MANLRVYTFTYTGNGVMDRAITGCPFTPSFVHIRSNNAVQAGVVSWVGLGADNTIRTNVAGFHSNRIKSFTSDGITLGTDNIVNFIGAVYYGFMIAGGSDCYYEGTYVGNGTGTNVITGVGFQFDSLILIRATTSTARISFGYGNTNFLNGNTQGSWTAPNSDGFDCGNANAVINALGSTYYFVAWKYQAGFGESNLYVGDATDNRDIASIDSPQVVIPKSRSGSQYIYYKSDVMPSGDNSLTYGVGGNLQPNYIQDLNSTGFQIGSSDPVNRNATNIHYMAFKDNPPSNDVGYRMFLAI